MVELGLSFFCVYLEVILGETDELETWLPVGGTIDKFPIY